MSDRLVKVEWVDSTLELTPWIDRDDLEVPTHNITTVGFLVNEQKKWITLAASIDMHTTHVGAVFHIPKGCIVKMEDLA